MTSINERSAWFCRRVCPYVRQGFIVAINFVVAPILRAYVRKGWSRR